MCVSQNSRKLRDTDSKQKLNQLSSCIKMLDDLKTYHSCINVVFFVLNLMSPMFDVQKLKRGYKILK